MLRYTRTPVSLKCSLTTLRGADGAAAEFVTPAAIRSAMRREKGDKYGNRKHAQAERSLRKDLRKLEEDGLAVAKVFA